MTPEITPVPGEPVGGVENPTTAPGSVAPATTTSAPSDAEKKLQEYETKLAQAEEARVKLEKDIGNVKSSLQRRESELTKEFQNREKQLRAEMERLATADMDDEERKIYEENSRARRLQELEEQRVELSRDLELANAYNRAYVYFTGNGIGPDRLILDQGYDLLYQSGMAAMEEDLKTLRTAPPQAATPPVPPEPPKAPPVVTTTATPAGTKATWAELIAKYGSEEEVFSRVEQGRLPASIIPS